jgi:hypothetical protein
VHVRRDLGALLLPDPGAALGRKVAGHPHPPRAAHQRQPGGDHQRSHQPARRAVQVRRPQDGRGADDHQRDADGRPRGTAEPVRPGGRPPAGPRVVVGLPPQDADADTHRDQRDGQARSQPHAQGREQQQATDRERAESQQHGEVPFAVARRLGLVRVLRGEHPEQPVRRHAGPAGRGEQHEGQPHHEHVDTQVVGQAAGNAGQNPPVAAAVQPRRRRCGRLPGGVGGRAHLSILLRPPPGRHQVVT